MKRPKSTTRMPAKGAFAGLVSRSFVIDGSLFAPFAFTGFLVFLFGSGGLVGGIGHGVVLGWHFRADLLAPSRQTRLHLPGPLGLTTGQVVPLAEVVFQIVK